MEDRFGRDPHVLAMREAFSRIEAYDRARVGAMDGVSAFDSRLAALRERTLERHLGAVARAVAGLDVDEFVRLYEELYEAEAAAMGLM